MSIISAASVKSLFERGDKPSQQDFEDLIDSAMRDTLIALATAGEGGGTGLVDVRSTAHVTLLDRGDLGTLLIAAQSTASGQSHLGFGTFGTTFIATLTTAEARNLLNVTSAGGATTLDELNDVSAAAPGTGAILYTDSGTEWTPLSAAANGLYLRLVGGIPAWSTAAASAGGAAGQYLTLVTAIPVSSIATVQIGDDIFTTSNEYYELEFELSPDNESGTTRIEMEISNDGGSTFVTSDIRVAVHKFSEGSAEALLVSRSQSNIRLSTVTEVGAGATEDFNGRISMYNSQSVSAQTRFEWKGMFENQAGDLQAIDGMASQSAKATCDTVKIFTDGSVKMTGFINVYAGRR